MQDNPAQEYDNLVNPDKSKQTIENEKIEAELEEFLANYSDLYDLGSPSIDEIEYGVPDIDEATLDDLFSDIVEPEIVATPEVLVEEEIVEVAEDDEDDNEGTTEAEIETEDYDLDIYDLDIESDSEVNTDCDNAKCDCPQRCVFRKDFNACGCACFEDYSLECNQWSCQRTRRPKAEALTCRENWHAIDGKCYYVSRYNAEYEEAKRYCREMNATLVKVTSRRQLFFISDRYDDRVTGVNLAYDPLWIDRDSVFHKEIKFDPSSLTRNSNMISTENEGSPMMESSENEAAEVSRPLPGTHLSREFYKPKPDLKRHECLVTNWDYIAHLHTLACDDSDNGFYSFKFVCEEPNM